MRHTSVADLMGETLVAVHGMERGSDMVTMETASGRSFRMYHEQDCCESVYLEDVIGEPGDLIGLPLLIAEEVSSDDEPPPDLSYVDSYTWTFYRLGTERGVVTLRWLGESNGYYSESVTFVEDGK